MLQIKLVVISDRCQCERSFKFTVQKYEDSFDRTQTLKLKILPS